MSEETAESASAPLPDAPNLDWLRKQAKRRLDELRRTNPDAQLADAQFDLAKQYGFSSWRALKAHIDSLTVDGQLFEAAPSRRRERPGSAARRSTRTSCTREQAVRVDAAARRRAARDTWRRSTFCSRAGSTSTRASRGQHLRDALGRGGGPRRRRPTPCRRRRRRRRAWRRPRAGGHRLGDVLGRLRRRRASRGRGLSRQRGARHHIFSADRDGSRRRGAPDRAADPAALNTAHEPEREPPDRRCTSRCEEPARRWSRCCRARRRSAGGRRLRPAGSDVRDVADVDRAVMEKIRADVRVRRSSAPTRGVRPPRGALDVISLLALAD